MIRIEHLSKIYGKETVLKDIHAEFLPGIIYGLVGENGCGKTTLMRCICGLCRPTSGKVFFDDIQIGKDRDFAPNTGIIIETPGFLPHYSGLKNLMILARISGGADEKRARSVMKQLGLSPDMKKPVAKYSLGMRQRLGIAQAIMEDPDILILDEPFNGLDVNGVKEIHGLFQQLRQQGKTILLASHSAIDIAQACDHVFQMTDGKFVSMA